MGRPLPIHWQGPSKERPGVALTKPPPKPKAERCAYCGRKLHAERCDGCGAWS